MAMSEYESRNQAILHKLAGGLGYSPYHRFEFTCCQDCIDLTAILIVTSDDWRKTLDELLFLHLIDNSSGYHQDVREKAKKVLADMAWRLAA